MSTRMVSIVSVFFLFLIMGCGQENKMTGRDKVRKDFEEVANDDLRTRKDLDGDGLKKNDPRPLMADVPSIRPADIKESELRFKGRNGKRVKYLLNESSEDISKGREKFWRKKILRLHYQTLTRPGDGIDLKEKFQYRSLVALPLLTWTDQEYYSFSEKIESVSKKGYDFDFKSVFRLSFDNLQSISRISAPSYHVLIGEKSVYDSEFLGEQGNPLTLEPQYDLGDELETQNVGIMAQALGSSAIEKGLGQKRNINLKIKDFKFVRDGEEKSFSRTLNSVRRKSSLFILSTPREALTFAYIKSGESVGKAFQRLSQKVRASPDGSISSVEGLQNSLTIPFDPENMNTPDYSKNSLKLLGARSGRQKSQPGEVYILSVAKMTELTPFIHQETKEFKENEPSIPLGEYHPGERFEVSVKIERKVPTVVRKSKKVSYVFNKCSTVRNGGMGPGQTVCVDKNKKQNVKWDYFRLKRRPVSLNDSFLKDVKVWAQGQHRSLSEFLVEEDSFGVVKGQTLKLRLKIPQKFRSEEKISLELPLHSPVKKLKYGYAGGFKCDRQSGMSSCQKKFATGRKVKRARPQHTSFVTVKR